MIVDRITLDFDSYEPGYRLSALSAWNTLSRMERVADVRAFVSSGGTGIHIVASLSERLSASERQRIRRTLGDDSMRTDLDTQRGRAGHATDISWQEKSGNGGEREEVADIWAALDRIEVNRTDYATRIHSVAKHGHRAVVDTHGLNRASMVDGL
jgi:hypothetical protein